MGSLIYPLDALAALIRLFGFTLGRTILAVTPVVSPNKLFNLILPIGILGIVFTLPI